MSDNSELIAAMVADMKEEHELSGEVTKIGESLFRKQFSQSFEYEHGPEQYWSHIESVWRAATDGKPIPTKYRTNKSVILKAHGHTPRLDEWCEARTDTVLGKTAVQNRFSKGRLLTKESGFRQVIRIIEKVRTDSGNDEHEQLCHDLLVHLAGEDEL